MKNLLLRIAVLLVGAAVVVPLMASSAEPTTGQYKVDKDRICVTGLSMGGYGTWSLASFSPDRFAALVPICGGGDPNTVRRFAHVAVWVFHGAKDTAVPIEELRKWKGSLYLDKPALREALNVLGDEAARHFENVLQQAVAQYPSVIAVTHVPPFKEAAWYTGRHSDDNYLPHFACKAVGDVMRKIMEANPKPRLLVLCGHTHGSGEVQITQNLQVLTGGAEYGNPVIQRIFDIG